MALLQKDRGIILEERVVPELGPKFRLPSLRERVDDFGSSWNDLCGLLSVC